MHAMKRNFEFNYEKRACITSSFSKHYPAAAPSPSSHKPILPERQRTPFHEARLILIGAEQGASAFSFIEFL